MPRSRPSSVPSGSSLVAAALLAALVPSEGRGQSAAGPALESRPCLACVATREATAAEWAGALAATAGDRSRPEDVAAQAAARAAAPRDSRTALERMRETAYRAYGDELARLSALAAQVDSDAQVYLSSCYERFLPVAGDGFLHLGRPGALARSAPPPPTEAGRLVSRPSPAPLRALFDVGTVSPAYVWSEPWTSQPLAGASMVRCEGMWREVHDGGHAVKAALDLIELDARANDVYPGVIRELFDAYSAPLRPALR